jgi:hypothetical protein
MVRFWEKVQRGDEPDACWVWTGALFVGGLGYGQFQFEGRPVLAHRMAWYLAYGRWPAKGLAHGCDIPACVRLDHLFEATALENNQDMNRKKRNPMSGKLSEGDVREIRRLRESGSTLASIASRYGVSEPLVSKVARRLVWAWVTDD